MCPGRSRRRVISFLDVGNPVATPQKVGGLPFHQPDEGQTTHGQTTARRAGKGGLARAAAREGDETSGETRGAMNGAPGPRAHSAGDAPPPPKAGSGRRGAAPAEPPGRQRRAKRRRRNTMGEPPTRQQWGERKRRGGGETPARGMDAARTRNIRRLPSRRASTGPPADRAGSLSARAETRGRTARSTAFARSVFFATQLRFHHLLCPGRSALRALEKRTTLEMARFLKGAQRVS